MSGEMTKTQKQVLAAESLEDAGEEDVLEENIEDQLVPKMRSRGPQRGREHVRVRRISSRTWRIPTFKLYKRIADDRAFGKALLDFCLRGSGRGENCHPEPRHPGGAMARKRKKRKHDGQCDALTKDGHRCTRKGTLIGGLEGIWLCPQHSSSQNLVLRKARASKGQSSTHRPTKPLRQVDGAIGAVAAMVKAGEVGGPSLAQGELVLSQLKDLRKLLLEKVAPEPHS